MGTRPTATELAAAQATLEQLRCKGLVSKKATRTSDAVVACAIAIHRGERFDSDYQAKQTFHVPFTTDVRVWVGRLEQNVGQPVASVPKATLDRNARASGVLFVQRPAVHAPPSHGARVLTAPERLDTQPIGVASAGARDGIRFGSLSRCVPPHSMRVASSNPAMASPPPAAVAPTEPPYVSVHLHPAVFVTNSNAAYPAGGTEVAPRSKRRPHPSGTLSVHVKCTLLLGGAPGTPVCRPPPLPGRKRGRPLSASYTPETLQHLQQRRTHEEYLVQARRQKEAKRRVREEVRAEAERSQQMISREKAEKERRIAAEYEERKRQLHNRQVKHDNGHFGGCTHHSCWLNCHICTGPNLRYDRPGACGCRGHGPDAVTLAVLSRQLCPSAAADAALLPSHVVPPSAPAPLPPSASPRRSAAQQQATPAPSGVYERLWCAEPCCNRSALANAVNASTTHASVGRIDETDPDRPWYCRVCWLAWERPELTCKCCGHQQQWSSEVDIPIAMGVSCEDPSWQWDPERPWFNGPWYCELCWRT